MAINGMVRVGKCAARHRSGLGRVQVGLSQNQRGRVDP